MSWEIIYHQDVEDDFKRVGRPAAKRLLKAIDTKLTKNPLQFGSPLIGDLSVFRKLRVGDYRVVYQVHNDKVLVFVLAVGPSRDKEIFTLAVKLST